MLKPSHPLILKTSHCVSENTTSNSSNVRGVFQSTILRKYQHTHIAVCLKMDFSYKNQWFAFLSYRHKLGIYYLILSQTPKHTITSLVNMSHSIPIIVVLSTGQSLMVKPQISSHVQSNFKNHKIIPLATSSVQMYPYSYPM